MLNLLYMIQFFYGLCMAAILDFRQKKHVTLLGNFATFDRSLRMTIEIIPEIFSFIYFFSIFALKDSYSFETRICGTVKCRTTLAYRVHFDSNNISDWTDYNILLQQEISPMLF